MAWGDVEMAHRLGTHLRGGLFGAKDDTLATHAMYETINHFRKHVETACGVSRRPVPAVDAGDDGTTGGLYVDAVAGNADTAAASPAGPAPITKLASP